MEDIATVIATVSTALWAISEVLALIPAVKANGIFHSFYIAIHKYKDSQGGR